MASRQPKLSLRADQPERAEEQEAVDDVAGVYQSEMCCEFSALTTCPCQSLT
jgi:hypothetical protein